MTQPIQDPDLTNEEDATEEPIVEKKSSLPPQKVSRFGPAGFQNGSKFGKGPTGVNPPNKQRPGRAAARGR